MLLVTAVLVLSVLTLLWTYSRWRHSYWSSRGVPTAPGCKPFFGHTHEMMKPKAWVRVYEDYKTYSGSGYCGYYGLMTPSLMVISPDLIKAITIKDFDHFVDRTNIKFTGEKDKIFNEMLTNVTGDHWKGIRSVLSPNFTSGRMRGMFPLVGQKVDAFLNYIHKNTKESPSVNLKKAFGCYTLEVISSCAFGLETSSFDDDESVFRTNASKLFQTSFKQIAKAFFFMIFPKLCAALKLNFIRPEGLFFANVVTENMKQRQKGGIKRGDFLDLMMEARQEQNNPTSKKPKYPLTDEIIIADSILFILAGFDTTANTLSFLSFLIAKHPKVQQQLREELKDIISKEGTLTYQAIMEAKLLDACISEALRLYPTAHTIMRNCTKNYKIPGSEVTISKDTLVSIPVWSLQHDPKYWSEPEVFRPDRFLPENKETIQSGTYLPFGLGPRNCIGMRFALMEAKLVIAKTLLEFELSLSPGKEEMELSDQIGVMRPHEDMTINFVPLAEE